MILAEDLQSQHVQGVAIVKIVVGEVVDAEGTMMMTLVLVTSLCGWWYWYWC